MRARHWLLSTVIAALCLAGSASATQAVRWQVDLESAKRLAEQTNRLVLVHFWADWCQACKEMEQQVHSQPEVAAALQAHFVPVRVNADHFPHTAQRYGISVLPSDVVITPQGVLLGRIGGEGGPRAYCNRLCQIAANAGNRVPEAYARMPSSPPAAGEAPIGPQGESYASQLPGARPPVSTAPTRGRYAEYFDARRQGDPPPTATGFGPEAAGSRGGSTPGLPGPQFPIPSRAMGRQPVVEPPEYSGHGSINTSNLPIEAGQRDVTLPQFSSRGEAPGSQAARPVIQLPPGNPPLDLDGYCPVQLSDGRRWVLGDVRWGLIHRGRTYLFSGPDARDRFNADPDHYAPVLSGNDVVLAVEQGQAVPGRREHGAWFQDRVYLFSSEATFRKFDQNPFLYVGALHSPAPNMAGRPGAPAQSYRQAPVTPSARRPY